VAQKVMRASAIATPLACALMLAPAQAQAAAAYVNPFAGDHPVLRRIDMALTYAFLVQSRSARWATAS